MCQVDGRMSDLLSSDPRPSDAHCVPTIQLLCNSCQHAQTERGGAKRPKQGLRSSRLLLLDIRSAGTVIPAKCLWGNQPSCSWAEQVGEVAQWQMNPQELKQTKECDVLLPF